MIECEKCPYFVMNKGYEYCVFFCQPLTRVNELDLCKWVKKDEDSNQDTNEGDSEEL